MESRPDGGREGRSLQGQTAASREVIKRDSRLSTPPFAGLREIRSEKKRQGKGRQREGRSGARFSEVGVTRGRK